MITSSPAKNITDANPVPTDFRSQYKRLQDNQPLDRLEQNCRV